MDYAAHYTRLIARARGRELEGYSEIHHVIPRSLHGPDTADNRVELTAEEHYVAHQLLVKMHPRNGRLVHAAVLMSTRCSNNKAYGWLKRRHIAQLAINMHGNTHTVGYHHTNEAKAKISATHLGTVRRDETKARMSASMRGNTNGLGKKLPPFTDEHRAKLSAAHQGKKLSATHKAKIGAAHLGMKHPGRKLTEEHKAKVGAAHRGMKRPPGTGEKISAALRAAWVRRRATAQV